MGTTASTSNVESALAERPPLASPFVAVQLTAFAPVADVGMVQAVVPDPVATPELSVGVMAFPLSVQLSDASPDGPTVTSSVSEVWDVHPLGGLAHDTCGLVSSTFTPVAVATVGEPDALKLWLW